MFKGRVKDTDQSDKPLCMYIYIYLFVYVPFYQHHPYYTIFYIMSIFHEYIYIYMPVVCLLQSYVMKTIMKSGSPWKSKSLHTNSFTFFLYCDKNSLNIEIILLQGSDHTWPSQHHQLLQQFYAFCACNIQFSLHLFELQSLPLQLLFLQPSRPLFFNAAFVTVLGLKV